MSRADGIRNQFGVESRRILATAMSNGPDIPDRFRRIELMARPDFMIIGAQKAGTSWLAGNLGDHPEIWMAPREIHYFDKPWNLEKGDGWYEEHFTGADAAGRIGEKTPEYLWANGESDSHEADVHRRIKTYAPDQQMMVVLRNPVDRAISAVNHIVRTGRVSPLINIDDLLVGSKKQLLDGMGVIDKGLYARQVEAWFELYPRDRFLVFIYEEDIVGNPKETLRRSCTFLGVDADHDFDRVGRRMNVHNRSTIGLTLSYHLRMKKFGRLIDRFLPAWKKKPTASTRAALTELFLSENERLFELLGRDMPDSWRR